MENEISTLQIEKKIFVIRGVQVMIDRDIAEFYGVETRRLNEQVKRNIERFPEEFMFQLTRDEIDLQANANLLKFSKKFTTFFSNCIAFFEKICYNSKNREMRCLAT